MFHEERDQVSESTQNMKRAIDSLREEFEAVDFYNQRADACTDPELKLILLHNAKEEKEHASMLLEWIRRNDPEMDHELKDNLFKEGLIRGEHQ
ncbi:MAG: ferritin family protein [Candidatus Gracilibacteria bacterium]|nr:ferritin family protein [Candidatus Gracilibacteria bacterium]